MYKLSKIYNMSSDILDFLNVEKVSTEDEIGKIIKEKILDEFCQEYILIGEDRTCLPAQYLQFAEQIKNFEVFDDDIWIDTFPKAGTTWGQEMIWMIANNVDFEGAKLPQDIRFPFLEIAGLFDLKKKFAAMKFDTTDYDFNSVKKTANQKSKPRFIKTHLPFSLLPDQIRNGTKTPKIIYIVRNPKDVCVSFCHHGNLLNGWNIDVDSFAKLFMADKAMYGSFWKHALGFYKLRGSPNILFLTYEEMKANLPAVIVKVAKFLEKELSTEQIEALTDHLSFDKMKQNEAVNISDIVELLKQNSMANEDGSFIRTGKVEQYKKELSSETIKELDAWISKNVTGTILEKEHVFKI